MFTITDAAGAHLTALLEQVDVSEETAVRFVLEGNTVAPKLDNARPGDATFDHGDKTVLVVDAQVSDTLSETTLDVQPTDEGPKLVLLR